MEQPSMEAVTSVSTTAPDWKQADRALADRASRVYLPVPVKGLDNVIALPSRAAYRVDVIGTRRRLLPKVARTKKERRRLREAMKRANAEADASKEQTT